MRPTIPRCRRADTPGAIVETETRLYLVRTRSKLPGGTRRDPPRASPAPRTRDGSIPHQTSATMPRCRHSRTPVPVLQFQITGAGDSSARLRARAGEPPGQGGLAVASPGSGARARGDHRAIGRPLVPGSATSPVGGGVGPGGRLAAFLGSVASTGPSDLRGPGDPGEARNQGASHPGGA